jgi:hypothetical protein
MSAISNPISIAKCLHIGRLPQFYFQYLLVRKLQTKHYLISVKTLIHKDIKEDINTLTNACIAL